MTTHLRPHREFESTFLEINLTLEENKCLKVSKVKWKINDISPDRQCYAPLTKSLGGITEGKVKLRRKFHLQCLLTSSELNPCTSED